MNDDALERSIRAACDARDFGAAATLLLRGYGPEIMGYLCARLPREGDAHEAYSDFALDVWNGLEGFAWRSSARVWAYAVARNAVLRHGRERWRRERRAVPLSFDLAPPTPTRTPTFLGTTARDGLAALRGQLSAEEQELLVLRVDKRLAWEELALVLADTSLEGEPLEREAARLRKRFQLVKRKLRTLARRAGLFDRSCP